MANEPMALKRLSPTRLEQGLQCEARLYARVMDPTYAETRGEGAATGILAHEAAKFWYRDSERVLEPDDAFKLAMEQCGKQKELPKNPSSVQVAREQFTRIIAHYNRDVIEVVFAERKYTGALQGGPPMALILDLGINRGGGILEIVDYKTGWIVTSTDDMYDKHQVLMNILAVRRDPMFAGFRDVQFTYFWSQHGFETGPVSFSDMALQDYQTWLGFEYARLCKVTHPVENVNTFCMSCGRKFQCEAYRQHLSTAMAEVTVLTEDQAKALPPDELLARYKELGSQEKALKKAREALKGEVLALIEGSGENSPKGKRLFKGASLKASLVQGQTTTYNVAAVLALCVKCGVSPSKVFSVGKKKADGAFVDNVPAMRALQDSATKVPSTPYPTISKVPVKKAAKPTKAAAKEPSDG